MGGSGERMMAAVTMRALVDRPLGLLVRAPQIVLEVREQRIDLQRGRERRVTVPARALDDRHRGVEQRASETMVVVGVSVRARRQVSLRDRGFDRARAVRGFEAGDRALEQSFRVVSRRR
jgi:hypothetical protein